MLSKLLNVSRFGFRETRYNSVSKFLYKSFAQTAESPISHEHNNNTNKPQETQRFWNKFTGKNSYKAGIAFLAISGLSFIGYAFVSYGPPELNEDGTFKEDEYSSMNPIFGYTCRVWKNLSGVNQTIKDPISDKLLPDPHPLYQPMTLVLEINDVLLHPEWTFKSGWKFKKRAGLELFLQAVSPFFEVVVYTNDTAMNLHPILAQIDPNFQTLHYRLYREATRYERGVHIKDLSALNRDLKKVIRIDWDKRACSLQTRNTLLIKRWTGDADDRELVDLAAFLRMIATNNLTDVREGLDYYAKFDDPLMEFRRRCEDLKEHMKKAEKGSNSQIKDTLKNFYQRVRRT